MKRRRKMLLFGSLLGATPWVLAGGVPPAEQVRIDRLIAYVESRNDVMFVRNGSAYSNQDAASFLRGKLSQMGDQVRTAQEFIDQIATKSSTSGEAYTIRFADGKTEPSAKFLGDELRRIKAAAKY